MLNKRAQILFDKTEWDKLSKIAKRENLSVSDLVRKAVKNAYPTEHELKQRRKAYDEIVSLRPPQFKGKIDYKELINYGRKY